MYQTADQNRPGQQKKKKEKRNAPSISAFCHLIHTHARTFAHTHTPQSMHVCTRVSERYQPTNQHHPNDTDEPVLWTVISFVSSLLSHFRCIKHAFYFLISLPLSCAWHTSASSRQQFSHKFDLVWWTHTSLARLKIKNTVRTSCWNDFHLRLASNFSIQEKRISDKLIVNVWTSK